MSEYPISELVASAMKNIKDMVDVNTIIGTPIETADGTTIIPVSKVSFGFGAGGSEFEPKKSEVKDGLFGGGSGAGVSISPLGFLVISPASEVKMIPISNGELTGINQFIQNFPETFDKVSAFVQKRKEKKMDD
ncbi:MAG: GerW family sporulation protein [Clostridia bacterium]|nr:GerW family sporulation protein [Clostridia bacterium]